MSLNSAGYHVLIKIIDSHKVTPKFEFHHFKLLYKLYLKKHNSAEMYTKRRETTTKTERVALDFQEIIEDNMQTQFIISENIHIK